MYTNTENRWSPFDPSWYKNAFDKFISTADRLFNTQDIIDQGYVIPDGDGSRSSVFRSDAVLNNSFDESKLREVLRDIYINSSHHLIAANHDAVGFYQWNGTMEDVTQIKNTKTCELVLPTETFVSNNRDKLKLSQFYRKWVSYNELLTNWDVFKWCCLLFIDQKPHSDFSLRMDEQQTTLRFSYQQRWVDQSYPIYFYKFPTNTQTIVKLTRRQVIDNWDWKIPVEYINDQRILNAKHLIGIFHRVTIDRSDNITSVDPISDNIEFLAIKDGVIDLANISARSKDVVYSEYREWFSLVLISPKYMREFPIPLAADVVYRSYRSDFAHAKAQYYLNILKENGDTIDADFKIKYKDGHYSYTVEGNTLLAFLKDVYAAVATELDNLEDLMQQTADDVEQFRWFMSSYTTDAAFLEWCDTLDADINAIHDAYATFLSKRWMSEDEAYESLYSEYVDAMITIRDEKRSYAGFSKQYGKSDNFWTFVSPLIYTPRELVEKYSIRRMLTQVDNKRVWEDIPDYSLPFKHPVEANDFWTFEYDHDLDTWRPYKLTVEHHFPDVYILADPTGKDISNRVFKAFFFCADAPGTAKKSIYHPTPDWDSDMEEYELQYGATYRDIFIEKFYWMGIHSVYNGLLQTDYKWELLEYVINNDSYERFNELFLKTMDPYFKMGLATYLRSANFEFPFDDAIAKMEESIATKFLGYERITNFERYLNATWTPSYFDYVAKVMPDWEYKKRLVKRPRASFDTTRFLPSLITLQTSIADAVDEFNITLQWILKELAAVSYDIDIDAIKALDDTIGIIDSNMIEVLNYTSELDLAIYSVEDVDHIAELLEKHIALTDSLYNMLNAIHSDAESKLKYEQKKPIAYAIHSFVTNELHECIDALLGIGIIFDMDRFMKIVSDPSYASEIRDPLKDRSLIGLIDRFSAPWPSYIKEQRNQLYVKVNQLYSDYNENRAYTLSELKELRDLVSDISTTCSGLNVAIVEWWDKNSLIIDDAIVDAFIDVQTMIDQFDDSLSTYIDLCVEYNNHCDELRMIMVSLSDIGLSETEEENIEIIDNSLTAILRLALHIYSDHDEISNIYSEMVSVSEDEISYITHEQEVFERILDAMASDADFITTVSGNKDLINAMVRYMKTVDRDYTPDSQLPSYSAIYKLSKTELVSGGFHHTVGNIAYSPDLGVFRVAETLGDLSEANIIELTDCRSTTFRDPTWQSMNPYDTITDGKGMGIAIKATESEEINIINDDIGNTFSERIEDALRLSRADAELINPASNAALSDIVDKLFEVQSDWVNILESYADHISDNFKSHMQYVMQGVLELASQIELMIDVKEGNDLHGLLVSLNAFIHGSYQYLFEYNLLTPTAVYFDKRLRDKYEELSEFYGLGSSWNDRDQCIELLTSAKEEMELYKRQVMGVITDQDVHDNYDDVIATIERFLSSLDKWVEQRAAILKQCDAVEMYMNEEVELQIDHWYDLDNVVIGNGGSGYAIGDIVQIVPELPTDSSGQPIHDDEEIIMNDKLFLQITQVEDGSVTGIKPLIDYAVPYSIWGARQTIACVGNGSGLVVNAYAREITLRDSTAMLDPSSYMPLPDQFDKNDMFTFKFNNLYDLDIQYEVFFAGKQIHDFVVRHVDSGDPSQPNKIDVIYLNANEVYGLQNSSIRINGEHYLVYKLENAEIVDPGVGYALGQEVTVSSNGSTLRLKVTKLEDNPLKQIAAVEPVDNFTRFKEFNPAGENLRASNDSLNNVDDEYSNTAYDQLTSDGLTKAATFTYPADEYTFTSHRFDDIPGGNRNADYLYPDVDMPEGDDVAINGDPDDHYYLGSRIDEEHRWNGIMNTQPPTDSFISDADRTPPDLPLNGEYQEIMRERICSVFIPAQADNQQLRFGDLEVGMYQDLPKTVDDWSECTIGKVVIVKSDQTHGGHRMAYRVRTFIARGDIIYEEPEVVDHEWTGFRIDWRTIDFYPEFPTQKQQYPDASWWSAKTHRLVENEIADKKVERKFKPDKHYGSYIADLTVDDLSVWNNTTHQWEDLHDETKWALEQFDYEWVLSYTEEGDYSYDMILYLNKIPRTQTKNAALKRNAIFNISTSIDSVVDTRDLNLSVNTGRTLHIRKLFPYEQSNSFTVTNDDKVIHFRLNKYMHYRNEIHLEDINIYNKTAGRYEDQSLFEFRFKNNRQSAGTETQTDIVRCLISEPGSDFANGNVWCWNEEYKIHVFATVTTDFTNGSLISITPLHFYNAPSEDLSLEFRVFQFATLNDVSEALAIIEFQTKKVQISDDGYIHNVVNPLAPVPNDIQIIPQYDISDTMEYEVSISKSSKTWTFVRPQWEIFPTFHLDGYRVPADRIYIMGDNGRFPLVNPANGKPTFQVSYTDDGTDVKFMSIYNKYEHIEVHTTPYPMHSVYRRRKIPSTGYIDLAGQINKPLNKKYFEFWMNGRLLYDEVTIISPTKIFLHGLKSLRNFEIIEINRDPNEFFSDVFLDVETNPFGTPYPVWNYQTYLDAALSGDLEGDNYTIAEQEMLLHPVWKQVEQTDPDFKDYPINQDLENDIIIRVDDYQDLSEFDGFPYQFAITDMPTINGVTVTGSSLNWKGFGFIPISRQIIVELLNEEWKDEITSGTVESHEVVSDEDWYGLAARLYDEYGIQVHTLNESAYMVIDDNLLKINTNTKLGRIVRKAIEYDLT